MNQLMDICGADYPERPERFEVIYNLLSLKYNWRIRVKVETDESSPVPSVMSVYSAAGWFERECWDLYGVAFSGNPDLRSILTDYGFDGKSGPDREDAPASPVSVYGRAKRDAEALVAAYPHGALIVRTTAVISWDRASRGACGPGCAGTSAANSAAEKRL